MKRLYDTNGGKTKQKPTMNLKEVIQSNAENRKQKLAQQLYYNQ